MRHAEDSFENDDVLHRADDGRKNDTHFQFQMSFQSFMAAWHNTSHHSPPSNIFVRIQTFNKQRE